MFVKLTLRCGLAWLLVTLCASVWAQTESVPEIYTCIDAKGRKLTSDRKIPECADREQKILNPSGTVKSRIGPTLTAQEREQTDAQNRSQQKENARLEEEKRRNRALLTRYPNVAAHQKERVEALGQITQVKMAAAKRVGELQDERAKLVEEMAFYDKDPTRAPVKLRQQLEAATQTLELQIRFMTDKDQEMARTNARFDEELLRLQPLWRMNATAQ
jgi:hypothetical protein